MEMFGVEYNWKTVVEETLQDFGYIGSLIEEGNINTARELLKLIEKKIVPFESRAPKEEISKIREEIKMIRERLDQEEREEKNLTA